MDLRPNESSLLSVLDLKTAYLSNFICIIFLLFLAHPLISHATTPRQRLHTILPPTLTLFDEKHVLGKIYHAQGLPDNHPDVLASKALADILSTISQRTWTVSAEPENLYTKGIFIGATKRTWIESSFLLKNNQLHSGYQQLAHKDAFNVLVSPDILIITALNPESTLRAIYQFAQHHLKARWFIPGKLGTHLPISKTITLPIQNVIIYPAFFDRHLGSVHKSKSLEQWKLQNGFSNHLSFNHNLYTIFTPELATTHPYYFPQIDQKPYLPTNQVGTNPQPNLAHPTIAHYTAKVITEYFDKHPDALSFSISINDSSVFDESAETLQSIAPIQFFRRLPNYSNLVFGFSNQVAYYIKDKYPEKFLTQLAYGSTQKFPDFKMQPKVIPYLTSDRSEWYNIEFKKKDIDLLKKWSKKKSEFLGSWEYYKGTPYITPHYFPETIQESLQILHQANVRTLMIEAHPRWGYDAPKIWLVGQLTWNPNQSLEILIDDFFVNFYGPAANPMKAFFELCNQRWKDQKPHSMWLKYYFNLDELALYSLKDIKSLKAYLDKAIMLTQAADSIYQKRILLTKTIFDFHANATQMYYAWLPLAKNPLKTKLDIQSFKQNLKYFKVAKTNFQKTPIPTTLLQTASIFENLEPHTRIDAISWKGTSIAKETFEEPFLKGDLHPIQIKKLLSTKTSNGFLFQAKFNEKVRLTHKKHLDKQHPYSFRIENTQFAHYYKWLKIPNAKKSIGATLKLRGHLTPGAFVKLACFWVNKDKKPLKTFTADYLPAGTYPNPITLAIKGKPPKDAVFLQISVKFIDFYPGDWVELLHFEVNNL